MVKALVMYGAPDDPAAFESHYRGTHVPLANKIPGVQRFEYGKVAGTPDGSPAPYFWFAELCFESEEAMGAGFGSSEGQAAVDDVPNFASGGMTIMFAEA